MNFNFDQLPVELVFSILDYISIIDIINLNAVSKFWFDSFHQSSTWQLLTQNRLKLKSIDFDNQLKILQQYSKTKYLQYDINIFYFTYVNCAHNCGIATPGLHYILQNLTKASYLAGRSGAISTVNYYLKFDQRTVIRALASRLDPNEVEKIIKVNDVYQYRGDIIIGLANAGDVLQLLSYVKKYNIKFTDYLVVECLRAIIEGGGCGVYDCSQYDIVNDDSYQSYVELLSFYPHLENQTRDEMIGIALQCCNAEVVRNLIYPNFLFKLDYIGLINKAESIKILYNLYPNEQFSRIAYHILLAQVARAPIIAGFIQVPVDILNYIFSKIDYKTILDLALNYGQDRLSYLILSNFPNIKLDLTLLIVALSLPLSANAVINNPKLDYVKFLFVLTNLIDNRTINKLYISLINKFSINKVNMEFNRIKSTKFSTQVLII